MVSKLDHILEASSRERSNTAESVDRIESEKTSLCYFRKRRKYHAGRSVVPIASQHHHAEWQGSFWSITASFSSRWLWFFLISGTYHSLLTQSEREVVSTRESQYEHHDIVFIYGHSNSMRKHSTGSQYTMSSSINDHSTFLWVTCKSQIWKRCRTMCTVSLTECHPKDSYVIQKSGSYCDTMKTFHVFFEATWCMPRMSLGTLSSTG